MKVALFQVVRQAIKLFFAKQPPARTAKRRRVAADESPSAASVQARRQELAKKRAELADKGRPVVVWEETKVFDPQP